MIGLKPGEKRFFVCKVRVKGVLQTGRRADIKKEVNIGDELYLYRDYDNKYDEYAVAVKDIYNNNVGYLDRNENSETAFYLDSGCTCIAEVSDVDTSAATVGILVNVYAVCDADTFANLKSSYKEFLLN